MTNNDVAYIYIYGATSKQSGEHERIVFGIQKQGL